ncbi:MAG: Bug family tripartite tricarboxylate transporter substrate binding protein [Burkholderiales bacterium]
MKQLLRVLSLLPLLITVTGAAAQSSYPDKPIRIIVQTPPGAAPDILARLLGQNLTGAWGKPVIVENAPGAAGIVAAEKVAKSAPDGYTLGMPGDAPMTTNVTLYGKLPYDPLRDFAHITIVAETMNMLVVHPSVSAKNVQELIALAKSQPGKLNYATAGSGTSQHLGGEMMKSMAGVDILHIPYKSAIQGIQSVLSGEVTMTFGNVVTALPYVRDGRLRALAVTSSKRSLEAPDVPTMAQAGLPGFEAVAWFGLVAPAGTPPAVLAKWHKETLRVLAQPEVRSKIAGLGAVIVGNSPEAFTAQIKAEIESKGKVIRATGAKPD